MRTATSSPWHRGELAVQQLVGERAEADAVAGGIHDHLPEPARAFLERQRLVLATAVDDEDRVWVTPLTGPAGFARAATPTVIELAATVADDDPLAALTSAGGNVGLLAIEPATRRRMRVNGHVRPAAEPAAGLVVDVIQALSNCPRYIQRREPTDEPAPERRDAPATVGHALTDADRRLVGDADTFFLGTVGPDGAADASHRGGSPGFVAIEGPTRLSFGDYAGNSMYLTLGNLHVDRRVGLLFVDWTSGDLLHLSGTAEVDYDADRAAARFPGALRTVTVDVEAVVRRPGRFPLRWSTPEPSRFNPPAHHEGR
ncbi:MAG: pyridoxamine 5'-phosphate oxidase family protein [Actinomycetota bacterium]|nr:pyridoxamine 5'-phosphate oxidase family protein [Actinomycetota bacterium]